MIFVSNIPVVKFRREINDAYIDNPHFSYSQFSKNYRNPEFTWHMLFDDKRRCLAGADVIPNYGPNRNYAFIDKMQSLVRDEEYGKKIMMFLKKFFGDIWLMVNPEEQPVALLQLYRNPELGLNEYVVPADENPYGVDMHYFATTSTIPKDKMLEFFRGI